MKNLKSIISTIFVSILISSSLIAQSTDDNNLRNLILTTDLLKHTQQNRALSISLEKPINQKHSLELGVDYIYHFNSLDNIIDSEIDGSKLNFGVQFAHKYFVRKNESNTFGFFLGPKVSYTKTNYTHRIESEDADYTSSMKVASLGCSFGGQLVLKNGLTIEGFLTPGWINRQNEAAGFSPDGDPIEDFLSIVFPVASFIGNNQFIKNDYNVPNVGSNEVKNGIHLQLGVKIGYAF